jgi:hypothetical protein
MRSFGYLAGNIGVYGSSRDSIGVYGLSDDFAGVWGENTSGGNHGYMGGDTYGAYGEHGSSGNYGSLGGDNHGVSGYSANGSGLYGTSSNGNGVYAYSSNSNGVHGGSAGSSSGVYGHSNGGFGVSGNGNGGGVNGYSYTRWGVYGESVDSVGVYGYSHTSDNFGFLGGRSHGVYGKGSEYGVYGYNSSSLNFGYLGSSSFGAYGQSYSGYGVRGKSTTGYAGYFMGDVHITGALSKGSGTFLIDHPLDPENRLLSHSFVESPENLLIYRGKVRLDTDGQAVVEMPEYFRALTDESEATIHLTSMGRPFLTGYEWKSDGASFTAYGEPGREVSWMVMADRDDPVIHQLRRPVEEDKGPDNKL